MENRDPNRSIYTPLPFALTSIDQSRQLRFQQALNQVWIGDGRRMNVLNEEAMLKSLMKEKFFIPMNKGLVTGAKLSQKTENQ